MSDPRISGSSRTERFATGGPIPEYRPSSDEIPAALSGCGYRWTGAGEDGFDSPRLTRWASGSDEGASQ